MSPTAKPKQFFWCKATSFQHFPRLPAELQILIWELVLNDREGRLILPGLECAAQTANYKGCRCQAVWTPVSLLPSTNSRYRTRYMTLANAVRRISYMHRCIQCYKFLTNPESLPNEYTSMWGKEVYTIDRETSS